MRESSGSSIIACLSQSINEVSSFVARASLDNRNILELKAGHGQTAFECPLDQVFICPRLRDESNAQKARSVLDELDIPYPVPERSVV